MLPALLILAFLVRTCWLVFGTGAIENEGTDYTRIAENLLAGNGYVGIRGEGFALWVPPLYPFLIALVSLLVGQVELAARLVSTVFGTGLVAATALIAGWIYGRHVGLIAGALTAVHPLLVTLSAAVYSESIYLTLMMSGVYLALRARDLEGIRATMASGLCFALAYLTRPEAFIFPILAVAFFLVTNRRRRAAALRASALLVGVFLAVSAPYIVTLSLIAGRLQLEAKSPTNLAIGQRMNKGLDYRTACCEVDEALVERGVSYQPIRSLMQSTRPGVGELARYVLAAARRNLVAILREVAGARHYGSPWIFVLVALGLFGSAWSLRRTMAELFLVLVGVCIVLSLLSVQFLWARFLFAFLPLLLVWAAKGSEELGRWTHDTAVALGGSDRVARKSAYSLGIVSALALLIVAAGGTASVGDLSQGWKAQRALKVAGHWLRSTAPPPRTVVDVSGIVAFYSGATWLPFPASSESVALRYIDHKKADYVVLRRDASRPYVEEWMRSGIPSKGAQLVYRSESPGTGPILVYRWNRDPG